MKCCICQTETDRPRVLVSVNFVIISLLICDECNGRVREKAANPVDCDHCGGTGLKHDFKCQPCGGYGWCVVAEDIHRGG